jgi:hypothetical protein
MGSFCCASSWVGLGSRYGSSFESRFSKIFLAGTVQEVFLSLGQLCAAHEDTFDERIAQDVRQVEHDCSHVTLTFLSPGANCRTRWRRGERVDFPLGKNSKLEKPGSLLPGFVQL